jgi:hypothetical protein
MNEFIPAMDDLEQELHPAMPMVINTLLSHYHGDSFEEFQRSSTKKDTGVVWE